MRLPNLTGEFRVVSDPELRFTPSGKAVASVTVIASESRKTDNGWEDGDKTPFISVSVWDQAGEALVDTITKGERVLVSGALFVREYDRNDGTKGQSIELKWATVAPVPGGKPKGERERPQGYAHGQQPQRRQAAEDPWATPASDQPPF